MPRAVQQYAASPHACSQCDHSRWHKLLLLLLLLLLMMMMIVMSMTLPQLRH